METHLATILFVAVGAALGATISCVFIAKYVLRKRLPTPQVQIAVLSLTFLVVLLLLFLSCEPPGTG